MAHGGGAASGAAEPRDRAAVRCAEAPPRRSLHPQFLRVNVTLQEQGVQHSPPSLRVVSRCADAPP
jgi:hypothetical protein